MGQDIDLYVVDVTDFNKELLDAELRNVCSIAKTYLEHSYLVVSPGVSLMDNQWPGVEAMIRILQAHFPNKQIELYEDPNSYLVTPEFIQEQRETFLECTAAWGRKFVDYEHAVREYFQPADKSRVRV